MGTRYLMLLAVASCGDFPAVGDGGLGDADPTQRAEVARVRAVPNLDVDVLFLIDDSASMQPVQDSLRTHFPAFIAELERSQYGLPNLHIGVATSDMGTLGDDGMIAPQIGSGPGQCVGSGKNGNLTTNSSPTISGLFISDISDGSGTRTTNYTGTLVDAFSAIAAVGAIGCGFEQHLFALKRALDNNPVNAGFLRADASLAIFIVGNEDDCSMAHTTLMDVDTTTLGPLQSFRCTRFGITCDVNGMTPDEMNTPNLKMACHSNEASAYLVPLASYAPFFNALKSDPSMLAVGVLAGPPDPFDVKLVAPPGGGTDIPALSASCSYETASQGTAETVPGVRLAQFAASFERGRFSPLCAADVSPHLTAFGRMVRTMVGDTCLNSDIAMPPNCVVTDTSSSGTRTLPLCAGSVTTNCYKLVMDPVSCSTTQALRLEVVRATTPPADTVTSVRCVI